MNKKADISIETIVKWLLALIFLILIIILITKLSGKSFNLLDKIKNLLRFG